MNLSGPILDHHSMPAAHSHIDPPAGCRLCARLVEFRKKCAIAEPNWFNGAVPSFGDSHTARVLIVGLAPGLQGANKTGRAFTGDQSGELLFATLREFGFLEGTYGGHSKDGLHLIDTMITNAVRCVPPANRPTAAEVNTCRQFLVGSMQSLSHLQIVVALGRVAHDSIVTAVGLRKSGNKFAHGARHELGNGHVLFDSYHCSRYNINTGRLTTSMFHDVFRAVRTELD
ncbi:MAG: uracil-DNA glycosylase family 4 [Hyphomicrobiaceae bacterium]|jgi:uracil-DNA glycosylase family 4